MEVRNRLQSWCNSLTSYSRLQTRVVHVGDVPLGGSYPIRIQSMTTTPTMDTMATVEQTLRMVESGCEYVRITAPSKNEAENLAEIKKELRKRGCTVPLIADIHFTPNAAEIAARIVEKVRVNPGNYADRKKFQFTQYTDDAYEAELERIRIKFSPLVKICREYGTAMRIGTNHGSLSDRIMSRFGDTPIGMVESALEFVRICESLDYHDIVLSMKASNPIVMVQAYRLLVMKMDEEGMNYPLHIGVTEAGDGDDGRIKSAVGIGTLLEDGLGDTVRVSLTEDPEFEAPVARKLVDRYTGRAMQEPIPPVESMPLLSGYERRKTRKTGNIGGDHPPVVVAGFNSPEEIDLFRAGYSLVPDSDKWQISDLAADYVFSGNTAPLTDIPEQLGVIVKAEESNGALRVFPLLDAATWMETHPPQLHFVETVLADLSAEFLSELKKEENAILVITSRSLHGMAEIRRTFYKLNEHQIQTPVIIKRTYAETDRETALLYASTDAGGLFIDGFGDGIWLDIPHLDPMTVNQLSFGILQATRTRISKTEYISCPSCGRTLFDLQETTSGIRSRTHHLKGVKISIMGCIVNGPGEMADADYGYVGSGQGVITLYRGKNIVKRNIPAHSAIDELIGLIREDGKWVDA